MPVNASMRTGVMAALHLFMAKSIRPAAADHQGESARPGSLHACLGAYLPGAGVWHDRCRSGNLDLCCPVAGQSGLDPPGGYSPPKEGEELHTNQRKFWPVVIGYVITILIGLALPPLAVALYFCIAVYLVVPFREVVRVLIRRPSSRQ